MPQTITFRAEPRDRAGKGAARAVRRSGRVPGVLYGEGKPAALITLDPRELAREVHRPGFLARLVEIQFNGQSYRTLPRDVQIDPVSDDPIHVDFLRITAGTTITVAVPVQFTGQDTSPGLRRGGMLNVVRHEIDVICPVESIPDRLTISLAGLEIGDSIHIGAVELPPGTRPALGRNFTVASIAAPTAVREEQAAALATAAAVKAAAEAAAAAGAPAETEAAAAAAAAGATPAGPAAAPAAAKPTGRG